MNWSEKLLYPGILLVFVAAFLVSRSVEIQEQESWDEAELHLDSPESVSEEVPEPENQIVKKMVEPNTTLEVMLSGFGFTSQDIYQLVQDTRKVYNLNRIVAGNAFEIETSPEGEFQNLRYEISDEEYLTATRDGAKYVAARHQVEFEVQQEELYGVLTESLYQTLKAMGERDQLIAMLAEILQWDIDFTAIQKGDWFKLVVEKKYLDANFVKYGRILALQFNASGKDFYGFLFSLPDTGEEKYFDDKGNSLRKAFLKVPFSFNPRISSGFSYSRMHPVLGKRKPHLGIDFAAPRGTPVLASASGKVVFSGWKGGFGRFVQIRHPNGFKTGYGHLSKILVKSGQAVQQGQRIGNVGSTGMSTGPHLDYRIQDSGGKYLNPRKKVSWPSDKPVDRRHWSEFAAVRDSFLGQLASIQRPSSDASVSQRAD